MIYDRTIIKGTLGKGYSATGINHDCNMLMVKATVYTIINYNRNIVKATVTTIVNYNRNTFIVQATVFALLAQVCAHAGAFPRQARKNLAAQTLAYFCRGVSDAESKFNDSDTSSASSRPPEVDLNARPSTVAS
jgi:hypothetical protein